MPAVPQRVLGVFLWDRKSVGWGQVGVAVEGDGDRGVSEVYVQGNAPKAPILREVLHLFITVGCS